MIKLLISFVFLLLLTGSLYAADGDLTVMGNLGVGRDAPDSGCETCKGKFVLYNPTRPWTYFKLSNYFFTKGYTFSIENGNAAHYANDGMGISFIANQEAPNRGAGYWTRMHKDGRLTIGEYQPAAQLSIYGTTPLTLTGTVNVTNGSSTITGNGTLFTTELKPESAIHINDGKTDQWGQVEGRTYTVTAIASNTSLTINSNYSGTTVSGLTAERDSNLFGIYSASKANKLLVTQDGNVGIGTTNPGADFGGLRGLEIAGNSSILGIGINNAQTGGTGILIRSGGLFRGFLYANSGADSGLVLKTGDDSGPLRLQTGHNDRVWITYNGNVGIGTTNPESYKLYVSGTAFSTGGWQSSDVRFKDNITAIESSLEKIRGIRGVSYTWKTDEYKDRGFAEGKHYGVIGQEIEKVLPEVVKEGHNGEKAVAYTELIPVLIEAVKEQQMIIEKQQKEMNELKVRIKELDAKGFIARSQ